MSSLSKKHKTMAGSHMLTTCPAYLTEVEGISACLPDR